MFARPSRLTVYRSFSYALGVFYLGCRQPHESESVLNVPWVRGKLVSWRRLMPWDLYRDSVEPLSEMLTPGAASVWV